MFKFLDNSRKEYIYNLIKIKILPNLNKIEFDELINCLLKIIEYICIRFSIDPLNYDQFWNQLIQNNNRDIIAIFNILLPYIDDKEGKFSLHMEIYNLSDISIKSDNTIQDDSINKYQISNIQYNLYNSSLIPYTIDFIKQNSNLLFNTIDLLSYNKYNICL